MVKRFVAPLLIAPLVFACGDGNDGPSNITDDGADAEVGTDEGADVNPDEGADDGGMTEVDIGPGDDGGTVDVEPQEPVLTMRFITARETKGQGEGEDVVTFVPADDLQLGDDDEDTIAVHVLVEAFGVPSGNDATLYLDGVEYGTSALGDGPIEFEFGMAAFNAVPLPHSVDGYVIRAETRKADGEVIFQEKTAIVIARPCDIEVIPAGLEDAGGQQCVLADANDAADGFQLDVQVVHTGGYCDDVELAHTIADGASISDGVQALVDGNATFEVTLDDASDIFDAPIALEATGLSDIDPSVTGEGTSAFSVDNESIAITSLTPDPETVDTLDFQTDLDGDPANGVQVDVAGTVAGMGDEPVTLTLYVDGESQGEVAPLDGTFTFPTTTFDTNGSHTIRVETAESCGYTASTEATYQVYGVIPGGSFVAPADGAVLLASGDGDYATPGVYETSFQLALTGAADDAVVTVECKDTVTGSNYKAVQSATIDLNTLGEGGTLDLDISLDTATVGNYPSCRLSYDGPNGAEFIGDEIGLTVGLPEPALTIVQPAPGTFLNDKTITVKGAATALDGQQVRLKVTPTGGVAPIIDGLFGTVSGGTYQFTVDLTAQGVAVPDGQYMLTVDATDVYGNAVSDLPTINPSVNVRFDTGAPLLTLLQPLYPVLDPVTNPAHADEEPDTPGYQITFRVLMGNEAEYEGAEICLQINDEDYGCKEPDVMFEAQWAGITLVPGPNVRNITGHDAFGNQAMAIDGAIYLDLSAPIVRIIEPAVAKVTANGTVSVVAAVNDPQSDAPIHGATVSLLRDGEDTGAVAVDNEDGTYAFADVPLVEGVNPFQVVADFAGEVGASAIRSVTYKVVQPEIAITSPAQDAVFNKSSVACFGTQADCLTTVTAEVTDAESGSETELLVDCGEGPESYPAEYTGGTVTYADVLLTNGATCTLTPQVTDLAEQTATGTPVTVRVDRTAPTVARYTKPFGDFLTFDHDKSPDPGMQHDLGVVVRGVEAGRVVTVTLTYGDPVETTTYEHTVTQDTPDGQEYTANFGLITYPEGEVTLRTEVSDAAGNSASLAKVVTVETNKPLVGIILPAYPGDACGSCGAGALCDSGQCWFKWNKSWLSENGKLWVDTSGVINDGGVPNLRVCSNAPSLAGNAPACSGGLTGGPYYQIYEAEVSNGNTALPITAVLPAGLQTVVVELRPVPGGAWISTMSSPDPTETSRRINVDTTSPTVTALTWPGDVQAPTNTLNAAEQKPDSPARTYVFTADADEDGTAAVYVNGAKAGTFDIVGGTGQIDLTLASGANQVYAVVTDRNGNASAQPPTAPKSTVTVDIVAPDPTIVYPSSGTAWINASDSKDIMVDVLVQPGEEAAGVVAELRDAGVWKTSTNVAGGQAIFTGALVEGTHEFSVRVTDKAGNRTDIATEPASISVDTSPPVANFIAPSTGNDLTEDADPAAPGFQVAVDIFTGETGHSVSWKVARATCTDATYTSCSAYVDSDSGQVAPGTASVHRMITIPVSEQSTFHRLRLTSTDEAGNQTVNTVDISITLNNCVVGLIGLPPGAWVANADCKAGTNCDLDLTAKVTGPCLAVGTTLKLYVGGAEAGSAVADAQGEAAFPISLTDGDTYQFQAKAYIGADEVGASSLEERTVDTTAPALTLMAKLVDGFDTPAPATPTEVIVYNAGDDQGLAPDFQMHAYVQVDDTNAAGATVAAVEWVEVGSGDVPAAVPYSLTTTDPGAGQRDMTFRNLTLMDGITSDVVFHIADPAGNIGTAAYRAQVDITPPAPIVLSIVGTDRRLPAIDLAWDAVGDNGVDGTAAAYDIRYSRNPIDLSNFEEACHTDALRHTEDMPAPAASGTPQAYVIAGPDPRSDAGLCQLVSSQDNGTWYVAARAVDAAGNWSDLGASSVVSTSELTFAFTRVVLTDTFADNVFGGVTVYRDFLSARGDFVGDVNGDGLGDFVIGVKPCNAFCLFYGDENLPDVWNVNDVSSMASPTGPYHDCAVGGAQYFAAPAVGKDLGTTIMPLGDANGDGLADFIVSGRLDVLGDGTVWEGYALVFLGAQDTGPDLSNPNIIITGIDPWPSGGYYSVCSAGNFTGATSPTGYPIASIAIDEPPNDALHIFPGDPTWTPATHITLDLDNPGSLPAHLTIHASDGPARFGHLCGPAGDVLPTPGGGAATGDLLATHMSTGDLKQLFVIPGRPITATSTVEITLAYPPPAPTAEDQTAVRIYGDTSSTLGFGNSFFGEQDLNGDGIADIMIHDYLRRVDPDGGDGRTILIFDGAKIAPAAGGSIKVTVNGIRQGTTWLADNGVYLISDLGTPINAAQPVRNWSGWEMGGTPTVDIAAGTQSDGVMIRVNHWDDTPVPDLMLGVYPNEDAPVVNPDGTGGAIGQWVGGGMDMDGDTLPDVVSGTMSGEVVIIR